MIVPLVKAATDRVEACRVAGARSAPAAAAAMGSSPVPLPKPPESASIPRTRPTTRKRPNAL